MRPRRSDGMLTSRRVCGAGGGTGPVLTNPESPRVPRHHGHHCHHECRCLPRPRRADSAVPRPAPLGRPDFPAVRLPGAAADLDDPDRHRGPGLDQLPLHRCRRPGRRVPGRRIGGRRTGGGSSGRPVRAADRHAHRLVDQRRCHARTGRAGARFGADRGGVCAGAGLRCVHPADRVDGAGAVGADDGRRATPALRDVLRGSGRRDRLRPRAGRRQPDDRACLAGARHGHRSAAGRGVRLRDRAAPDRVGRPRPSGAGRWTGLAQPARRRPGLRLDGDRLLLRRDAGPVSRGWPPPRASPVRPAASTP